MKEINLRVRAEYFKAIRERIMPFQVFHDDDNIQAGDILVLQEGDEEKEDYTGHTVNRKVSYVLRDSPELGLMKGYCIVGFEKDDPDWYKNQNETTVEDLVIALCCIDKKAIVLNGDDDNIRMHYFARSQPGMKNMVSLW